MKKLEFLLQKEGDRAWLPLETSDVEILEGKYRVVARIQHPNTDIEIRVTHTSFDPRGAAESPKPIGPHQPRRISRDHSLHQAQTRTVGTLLLARSQSNTTKTLAVRRSVGSIARRIGNLRTPTADRPNRARNFPRSRTNRSIGRSRSRTNRSTDRSPSPTNCSAGRSPRTNANPSSRFSTAADQNLPIPHSPNPRTQTGRQTRTRPRSRNLRHSTRSPLNHFRQNRHSPASPKNQKNSNSYPRIRSARTQTTHRFSTTANLPARPPNLKNSRRNPAADARTSSPLHLCLRHLHSNRVQKPPNFRRSNSQQRWRHPSHQTIHNYSSFRAPSTGN